MNDLKLNDIKPLVQVDDYSFYLFLLIIIVAIVFIALIIYIIYNKFKNKKQNKKKSIDTLKELNYDNPKKCAYIITENLRTLCKSDREKSLARELINDLNEYKYKKDVSNISDEIKAKLNILVDMLDA